MWKIAPQDWLNRLAMLAVDLVYVVLHNWMILLVLSLGFIVIYATMKARKKLYGP